MATIFSKLLSIFALLTLFSSLIQARESQFFSKVSATPTTNNVANVPNRQVEEQNLFKQEQEATFIPDNQDQGYGLYGHETTQNVQATTTTNNNNYVAKIPTKKQETFSKQGYGLYGHETTENFQPTTTTATYRPYMTTEAQENFNNNKDNYYNKNGYESAQQQDTRQGMSDTRFMENGKYYYDVQNKQIFYNPNQFDQYSRNNYDEQYNREGYYGNTGYQNQEEVEEFENEP